MSSSEPKGHWEDGGKVWVEDHDCSLPEAREAVDNSDLLNRLQEYATDWRTRAASNAVVLEAIAALSKPEGEQISGEAGIRECAAHLDKRAVDFEVGTPSSALTSALATELRALLKEGEAP